MTQLHLWVPRAESLLESRIEILALSLVVIYYQIHPFFAARHIRCHHKRDVPILMQAHQAVKKLQVAGSTVVLIQDGEGETNDRVVGSVWI